MMMIVIAAVVAVGVIGAVTVSRIHASTCAGGQVSRGSSGSCVKDLQIMLNYRLPDQLSVDGRFGPDTQKKVKEFQSEAPGSITPDGIAGKNTWRKLCSATFYNSGGKTSIGLFRSTAHAAGCPGY